MTLKDILTKDYLIYEHVFLEKSGTEIAKQIGCTTTSVCSFLKRHSIYNRSNIYKIGKPSTSRGKFQKGHSKGKGISKPSPNKGKKFPRQELHWNWKGGSKEKRRLNDPEYRDWRKAVFERDDYTCQCCGERGRQLNADHIQPWKLFPALRYDLSNGRTLCVPCHRQTDTYGGRVHSYDGGVMRSVTIT